MKYVGFSQEEKAEKWAREKLRLSEPPGFFRAAAAVDKTGAFVCVVVLTNFTPRNVDVNVAIDKTKVRPKAAVLMFKEIFDFLFQRLRVARVTALLRSKNTNSRNLAERLGFKLEGTLRNAFKDDDMCVYGFLADEYRAHAWHRR